MLASRKPSAAPTCCWDWGYTVDFLYGTDHRYPVEKGWDANDNGVPRWNSDPRWPEDINIALNDLSRLWQTRRRILIVDGRERLLSALSLAHNAALGFRADRS